MVGRLVSFWEGLFSGAMLVSGRVVPRRVSSLSIFGSQFSCVFFLAPFPKTLSFLQAQRDPNGSVEACVNVDLVSALEGADKVFSMLLVFTSKKPTGTKWASATCGAWWLDGGGVMSMSAGMWNQHHSQAILPRCYFSWLLHKASVVMCFPKKKVGFPSGKRRWLENPPSSIRNTFSTGPCSFTERATEGNCNIIQLLISIHDLPNHHFHKIFEYQVFRFNTLLETNSSHPKIGLNPKRKMVSQPPRLTGSSCVSTGAIRVSTSISRVKAAVASLVSTSTVSSKPNQIRMANPSTHKDIDVENVFM